MIGQSTAIYLHHPTQAQDLKGEWIPTIEKIEVFAEMQSISSSEFFAASQIGLAPEMRFTMLVGDYNGETVVEHNGVNYSVYRTYQSAPDVIELYCQREAGTATVTEDEPAEISENEDQS